MKIALAISTLEHEELSFVAQLGVKDVILGGTGITDQLQWDYLSLLNVRSRLDLYGLRIAAIENIPEVLWRDARVGGPDRDQQIDHVLDIIRTLGKVGVRIFAYNWSPIINVWGHYRHGQAGGGRGGAGLTSFDYDLVKDGPLTDAGRISAEEIFQNHVYFLKAAMPVAEQADVKLAVHPNDPPAPELRGLGRHMISVESYQRVLDAVPNPYNGIEFCQGTVIEMADVGGSRLPEVIRHFGRQGKIFFVHFRNIKGKFPKFDETFQDDGDADSYEAIRAYLDVGFDGPIRPDHSPAITGDNKQRAGMAYSIGYMRAMIDAVQRNM